MGAIGDCNIQSNNRWCHRRNKEEAQRHASMCSSSPTRCADLRTNGCFLFHLLQTKVRRVYGNCLDVLTLGQKRAQHSQDIHGTDLVPVQVNNGQSVSLIRVWDVLIRVGCHGPNPPLPFQSLLLQSVCTMPSSDIETVLYAIVPCSMQSPFQPSSCITYFSLYSKQLCKESAAGRPRCNSRFKDATTGYMHA